VKGALAIAGRELRASFYSPAGYIIVALFMLLASGVFIARGFDQGKPASLRPVFEWGLWLLLLVCPAISMRAIAEEKRLGTFETLMTSPVNEAQVVLGKFFGCFGFLAAMLAPTLLLVIVLELYGRPDYGELLCGYFGLLLAGSAYIASGMLASTLTVSQAAAFLMTVFFWLILSVTTKVLPPYVSQSWSEGLFAADPDPRLRDFAIGLIDSSNVIYFTSITALFLVAAIKTLELGRWR
jgi:ABC-2 type transport system permease protein